MRKPDWCAWMWVFGVIGIKLPPPQKLSHGPFGSDGCWLGSSAPPLQMPFEDCFHPPLETQGQIRNRLFFLLWGFRKFSNRHKYTSTVQLFRLPFPPSFLCILSGEYTCTCTCSHTLPERKYSLLYLLAPRQFPSKEKKMLRTSGLENPFNSPVFHHSSMPPYLPHTAC